MIINNVNLKDLGRPFLVAEGGSTHQGKADWAIRMAKAAVESGADALTFQEIDEKKLYTELKELPVAPQQRVGWECLKECREIAKKAGMAFSVCVTDSDSLDQALRLGIDFIKIVSYDITFIPFLKKCGETRLPILMSTGASTFEEVGFALDTLNANGRVALYHTDCGYPTKDHEVNLLRMVSLKHEFSVPVGYCDHTNHGLSCLAATALGADIIEKHFTLDRKLEGSDFMVALEPQEIRNLFSDIKRVSLMRGSGKDQIEEGDLYRRNNLRRSIALKHTVEQGHVITLDDLTMMRPPVGLPWDAVNQFIGKKAVKELQGRHILKADDVQ